MKISFNLKDSDTDDDTEADDTQKCITTIDLIKTSIIPNMFRLIYLWECAFTIFYATFNSIVFQELISVPALSLNLGS